MIFQRGKRNIEEVRLAHFLRLFIATGFGFVAPVTLRAQGFVNARLPLSWAVWESQDRLLAWDYPEENLGYDKVPRSG